MIVEKNQTVVNVALDTKVSMIDLQNVQQTIMDRLNELMRTFDGMFADKEGTRKKFAQLEKAINKLNDMMKHQQDRGNSIDNDDAMLTKKSVGPMDCASCDKGIVNLNAMRAEHLSWNRLPFREPNERIAKYG